MTQVIFSRFSNKSTYTLPPKHVPFRFLKDVVGAEGRQSLKYSNTKLSENTHVKYEKKVDVI